mmetsp:Transcript_40114/g.106415  ORF Transcript_40114/g.106415 Transcript_40114/m.106415 type:complete len:298 (-) Transcript_40114:3-896(-)
MAQELDALRRRLSSLQYSSRFTLGCKNRSRSLSLCQIDFALLVSFTLQDLRTFAALGLRLHLHCLLDRGGRDDISNLVPETLDAPSPGGFVDNRDNSLIESISLFEGLVQRHTPDLGSHRCLCKLLNGEEWLVHSVGRLVRIDDTQVENAIDADRHVVPGDRLLIGDQHRLLFEGVHVGNAVDERQQEVDARVQDLLEFSKSFDDPRQLLWHDHDTEVPPRVDRRTAAARNSRGPPPVQCNRMDGKPPRHGTSKSSGRTQHAQISLSKTAPRSRLKPTDGKGCQRMWTRVVYVTIVA